MPTTEPEVIQVAVGIARNSEGRLLIGERPAGKDYAGQWEFPGGKIEPGEDVFDALVREFLEELNLEVHAGTPLFSQRHRYPDRVVELHLWLITEFSGDPQGLEGQKLQWAGVDTLRSVRFLEGNRALLDRVCELVL